MQMTQCSWLLVVVVVVTCVTSDRMDEIVTRSCPSVLFETGDIWKGDQQNITLHLNSTNTAQCIQVQNNTVLPDEKSDDVPVTNVALQAEDVLSLQIELQNPSENSTVYVTLYNYSTSTYDVNATTSSSTNETREIILDTRSFSFGSHILSVTMINELLNCSNAWYLNITMRKQECIRSRDSLPCSNTGYCADHKNTGFYKCSCCPGYLGKYCEEKDACYGNPCQNGGFCVDIAEGLTGSTFQCLCPHGFRGRSCEDEVSLCDRKPCRNDGSCHGNQTHYACLCPRGFKGKDCEVNVNECLSNPCIHGVCEDGVGRFKCYCLPGYGGDHCEFEYDECDSSPCINSGACEDLVATYRCHCGPGYKGTRCEIKVDLCTPNPCPAPAQCVDRGNNYSCICTPKGSGPGCTQHYDPCYPNPCRHGGSCLPSMDSYFCSCSPGYTGDLCEEAIFVPQHLPRRRENLDVNKKEQLTSVNQSDQPIDHWHNVYIAGAMLSFAATLVVFGAVFCHCRTHKTYLMFTRGLSRSCNDVKQQKTEEEGKFSLNLRGNTSETRPSEPTAYEASSVDVIENLDAPLII